MPIAKGSKSKILWAPESTFNVAPASAYTGLSFGSESLVENINKIVSDEIRSDRQVPSIRGGNIAVGGSVTTDFSPARHLLWLKHLMAATVVETVLDTTDITTLAAYTAARGDLRKIDAGGGSNWRIYTCIQGGVVTSGDVTTSLTSTSGREELTNTAWEYATTVATGADAIWQYVLTPGVDYPTEGLCFEKQILGQTSPLIVAFTGCRINTLGLTVPQEGIVQAEWGIVGMKSQKLGATNSTSITTALDDPFIGAEAYLLVGSGTAARPVREGNLNITNNVEENVYCWGSRHRKDVPANRREVNGQITLYFEDHVEYDAFKNETEQAISISFCRQGKFLNLAMGETKLTGQGTPSVSGSGVLTAQYALDAYVQDGASDLVITARVTADVPGL